MVLRASHLPIATGGLVLGWDLVQFLSMGTYHPKTLSVFNMGKRGEISGPIRVLHVSFSLKLSTIVFSICQFIAIFAPPPSPSSFLLVSFLY